MRQTPPPARGRRALLAAVPAVLGLPGCSGPGLGRTAQGAPGAGGSAHGGPVPRDPLPAALRAAFADRRRPCVLALGEVHDHPGLHECRLDWLHALTAGSQRCCLVLEQFDRSRQSALEGAQQRGEADPRAVAAAGGFDFAGWAWPPYEALIALAMARGLPLVAGNLPGPAVAAIARGRSPGGEPPAGWRDDDEAAQRRLLDEGHCGLLPASALAPMARAQRARDGAMAEALVAAIGRHRMPAVLIAGNGHVRRDLGVPRFLAPAGHAGSVLAVGFIEDPQGRGEAVEDPSGCYDWLVGLPAHPRPDPCEGLRARFGRPRN